LSSICRRTGSATPYARRSVSMRSASRVASQDLRRDSSGWADEGLSAANGDGPTPARRVSCSPGAEGALVLWEGLCVNEERCASAGTMRRDYETGVGG
jgi:hypothetical protein